MISSSIHQSSGCQNNDLHPNSTTPQTRMCSDNKLLVPARTWRPKDSRVFHPPIGRFAFIGHEDPDDGPHKLGGHRGLCIRRLYDGNDKLSMTSGQVLAAPVNEAYLTSTTTLVTWKRHSWRKGALQSRHDGGLFLGRPSALEITSSGLRWTIVTNSKRLRRQPINPSCIGSTGQWLPRMHLRQHWISAKPRPNSSDEGNEETSGDKEQRVRNQRRCDRANHGLWWMVNFLGTDAVVQRSIRWMIVSSMLHRKISGRG